VVCSWLKHIKFIEVYFYKWRCGCVFSETHFSGFFNLSITNFFSLAPAHKTADPGTSHHPIADIFQSCVGDTVDYNILDL